MFLVTNKHVVFVYELCDEPECQAIGFGLKIMIIQ